MTFSPIFRMTLGLILLTVSLILFADMVGILPDKNAANLEGRKKFSELLAIQIAKSVENDQTEIIGVLLRELVTRNEDVLSIALINPKGEFLARFGDHKKLWEKTSTDKTSTPSHIQVPIYKANKEWGRAQIRYSQLSGEGFWGFVQSEIVLLILFLSTSGFFLYRLFLKRSLRYLDPSSVIPGRVKEAMDIMTEPIIILDKKEYIVFANEAFPLMVDIPSSKLIGKKASDLDWDLSQGGTTLARHNNYPWVKTLNSSETYTKVPLKFITPNNVKKSFKVNAAPIANQGGKVNGVIVTFDDVTQLEQKNEQLLKAHQEVKESQAQLVQSEKMAAIGQMVAGVAHEINTPLGYVSSSVEMVGDMVGDMEGVSEDIPTLINEAKSGLSQISEIVLNLQDFSRMDRSAKDFVNINEGLESTLKVGRNVIKNSARITKSFGKLPAVQCAPSQINQVFLNVITNAVHAIESTGKNGVIEIKTNADGEFVYISIKDDGCGMDEAVQSHIFDAFYTTKDVGEGTGLGMSISYKIIQDHGGNIKVTSKPGVGTEFLIQLPIKTPLDKSTGEAA